MKFKKLISACILSSAITLASCGGGGSSGNDGLLIKPVELTGIFIDSPVAGLRYFTGNKMTAAITCS